MPEKLYLITQAEKDAILLNLYRVYDKQIASLTALDVIKLLLGSLPEHLEKEQVSQC